MSALPKYQRKIVVSGANGLVGRAVCRELCDDGNHVVAIVRPGDKRRPVPEAHYLEIDLASSISETLESVGEFYGAIHLAQEPGWHAFPANSGRIARVNIGASLEFAEAAKKANAKSFVFASSGGIHGSSRSPIQENYEINTGGNIGFYLDTKVAAERLLSHFQKHLNIHILRPFFVYGANQSERFLITRLLNSVKNGDAVKAAEGRGPQLNPVHVEDAAKAFCSALDLDESVTSNIAGPNVVSIADIALLIEELTGVSSVIDRTGMLEGDFVADISTMTERLHTPEIKFRDGLLQLIRSLKE